MGRIITGYKGFGRDFTCRGFQYEVGKTYEIDGEPKLYECGFHFCTSPLAVFRYYDPTNRFAIVKADEDDVVYEKDTYFHKAVARRIKIVAEVSFDDLIELQREYALRTEPMVETGETCSLGGEGGTSNKSTIFGYGYDAILGVNAQSDYYVANNGDCSVAVAAGTERAVGVTKGNGSAAVTTGLFSMAKTRGSSSIAVATNRDSVAIAQKCAAAVATSDEAVAVAIDKATAMCTGFGSVAEARDKSALAVAAGEHCSACGVLGSWLVLVQRFNNYILDVQTVLVDGLTIKEGVRYELVNGKICEVCE